MDAGDGALRAAGETAAQAAAAQSGGGPAPGRPALCGALGRLARRLALPCLPPRQGPGAHQRRQVRSLRERQAVSTRSLGIAWLARADETTFCQARILNINDARGKE